MSRWRLAALTAGAAAAAGGLAWVSWPPHPGYLPFLICYEVIGLSFLAAGIAAWLRWPGRRLGLAFGAAGYLYLLPYLLVNLANPVAFTIGVLSQGWYAVAVAYIGLAWPSGRLRSGLERGVIVADGAQAVAFSVAMMSYWNPAFGGCTRGCPVNLLLVGHGSQSVLRTVQVAGGIATIVVTVTVLALIARHFRSARGWSRRAMIPLMWIAPLVGAEQIVIDGPFDLSVPNLVSFGLAPLVMLAGPALFVISTVRARTAGGALGTAIVSLDRDASPVGLRDVLARALGDSSLQLAFRRATRPATWIRRVRSSRRTGRSRGERWYRSRARTGRSWSTTRAWRSSRS